MTLHCPARAFSTLLLFVSAFGLCGCPFSAYAQDVDSQLWTQFVFNARSRRLRMFAEFQPRFGNNYRQISMIAARSAVGYQITHNFSVWAGWNWQPSFLPEFNDEGRWFQQFLLEDRYPGLDMTNRTRLEERNIAGAGDTSVRLRHLLRLSHPLNAKKSYAVVWSNELFWNFNTTNNWQQEFDRNRAYVGFSHNLTQHTRVELGYLAEFINPSGGRRDRRNDVLMFSLNYTL